MLLLSCHRNIKTLFIHKGTTKIKEEGLLQNLTLFYDAHYAVFLFVLTTLINQALHFPTCIRVFIYVHTSVLLAAKRIAGRNGI